MPDCGSAFFAGLLSWRRGRSRRVGAQVLPIKKSFTKLDLRFQHTIGELIREGILGPHTLVLDDTGHSIPNLARADDLSSYVPTLSRGVFP